MWKTSTVLVVIAIVLLCMSSCADGATQTLTSPYNSNIKLGLGTYGIFYDRDARVGFSAYGEDRIDAGYSREGWGIYLSDKNQHSQNDNTFGDVGIKGLANEDPPNVGHCTAKISVETSSSNLRVLYCIYFRKDFPNIAFVDTTIENPDTTPHNVIYRRVVRFGKSTGYSSLVGNPSNRKATTDNGGSYSDPSTNFAPSLTPPYRSTSTSTYALGVGYDINLGSIAAGNSKSFTVFIGQAATEADQLLPTSVGGLIAMSPTGQVFYGTNIKDGPCSVGSPPCSQDPVFFYGFAPLLPPAVSPASGGGSGSCIGVYKCSSGTSATQFTTFSGGTCASATAYPTTVNYVAIVSAIGASSQQTFYTVPTGCSQVTIINSGGASQSCVAAVNSNRAQHVDDIMIGSYTCTDTSSPSLCGFSTLPPNVAYDTAASAASATGGCASTCCCYTSTTGSCKSKPMGAAPLSSPQSYKRDGAELQQVRRNIIAINATMPNILDSRWVQQMLM